jgi:hypothetical protein
MDATKDLHLGKSSQFQSNVIGGNLRLRRPRASSRQAAGSSAVAGPDAGQKEGQLAPVSPRLAQKRLDEGLITGAAKSGLAR